jgi:hypothetical protein
MTADSSMVVGRWVVVLLGVLAWLVVVPFMALAAELAESTRGLRSRRIRANAARASRGLVHEI